MPSTTRLPTVLIVGAGVSGLVYAAVLQRRGFDVRILEASHDLGGLWLGAELDPSLLEHAKPRECSGTRGGIRTLQDIDDGYRTRDCGASCNAIYEELFTNLPHATMVTDIDVAAARSTGVDEAAAAKVLRGAAPGAFVPARAMQEHVRAVARLHRLDRLIRFRSVVTNIRRVADSPAGQETGSPWRQWHVEWEERTRSHDVVAYRSADVDFVVVANGHYGVPFIPRAIIPKEALDAGDAKHPGIVIHSAAFTHPRVLDGKKVLVVGAGPSGRDIAAGLLRWRTVSAGIVDKSSGITGRPAGATPLASPTCASSTVGWSVRLPEERAMRDDAGRIEAYLQSPEDAAAGLPRWLQLHPEPVAVERLPASTVREGARLGAAGSLRVRFKDGRTAHYDVIISATGYRYSFPFLEGLTAPPAAAATPAVGEPPLENRDTGVRLVAGGHGVAGLAHNLLPERAPSMAFATLSYGIAPYQLACAQAEFCATLWQRLRSEEHSVATEMLRRVTGRGAERAGRVSLGARMWALIDGFAGAASRPVASRLPELMYLVTGDLRRRLPLGEYQRAVITDVRRDDASRSIEATVHVAGGQTMSLSLPLPARLAKQGAGSKL